MLDWIEESRHTGSRRIHFEKVEIAVIYVPYKDIFRTSRPAWTNLGIRYQLTQVMD